MSEINPQKGLKDFQESMFDEMIQPLIFLYNLYLITIMLLLYYYYISLKKKKLYLWLIEKGKKGEKYR